MNTLYENANSAPWAIPAIIKSSSTVVLTWEFDEQDVYTLNAGAEFRQFLAIDWNLPAGEGFVMSSRGDVLGFVRPGRNSVEVAGTALEKVRGDRRLWAFLELPDLEPYAVAESYTKLKIPVPELRVLAEGRFTESCSTGCNFAKKSATLLFLYLSVPAILFWFALMMSNRAHSFVGRHIKPIGGLKKAIAQRARLHRYKRIFRKPPTKFLIALGLTCLYIGLKNLPYYDRYSIEWASNKTDVAPANAIPQVISLSRAYNFQWSYSH